MEELQLRRYAFFRWLGVFAVDSVSSVAGRRFLRATDMILQQPDAMLWVTPEARFVDVRERPVRFAPGLAHVAIRYPDSVFAPLAVEYAFGTEKRPEVYLRFGTARRGRDWGASVGEAHENLERALCGTQDLLAGEVISRSKADFRTILRGDQGVSLPYDAWRRVKAWWAGEKPVIQHSWER
jgi:hypothetical protein